jgi:NAD(P)-dependent dehydrogenase (short-subunit alcohol dehydrogenase family)
MKAPHSLIIGGTRGIGREVVHHLLREGHRVSVIARRPPARKVDRTSRANYWSVDVRDETALVATLSRLVKKSGKINHLIFFQRHRGDDEPWHGEIETSLTATKSAVEALQDKFAPGQKSIVIVSSIAAKLIGAYLPLGYHVAKAALCQMVRYWAVTLGARGIRVNSVSPGTVLKAESKEFFLNNTTLCELYRRITPLRRFGHASEVANVIALLCSDQTSFVTGQDIVVDGGVSLLWQEWLARELLDIPQPPTRSQTKTGHK